MKVTKLEKELELSMEELTLITGHLDSLVSIRGILARESVTSTTSHELARITADKITKDLNIRYPTIGIESHIENVAIESISDLVQKAIDKLTEIIKAVFDKIKKLLKLITNDNKNSAAKLTSKKAAVSAVSDFVNTVRMTDEEDLKNFEHLLVSGSSAISTDDIIARVSKFPSTLKTIERYYKEKSLVINHFGKKTDDIIFILNRTILELEEDSDYDPKSQLDKINVIFEDLFGFARSNIYDILGDSLTDLNDLPWRELEEKGIDSDDVNENYSFVIKKLVGNLKIYVLDITDDRFLLPLVIHRKTESLENLKEIIVDLNMFTEFTDRVITELGDPRDEISALAIINKSEKLMLSISKDLKNHLNDDFYNTGRADDIKAMLQVVSRLKEIALRITVSIPADVLLVDSVSKYRNAVTQLIDKVILEAQND